MELCEFDEKYVPELRVVFYTSIHMNAKGFYSESQLDAWAPESYDKNAWYRRMVKLQPFVAVSTEGIVGYADLQADGYIDHFFVRGGFAGKGVGTILMGRILELASLREISRLYSEVSLAAQGFFSRNGFKILRRQVVTKGDVELENAAMELLFVNL